MLTIDCILKRRSVRNFKKDQVVKDEDIKTILKSAMHAPSAMNKQPWEFIVIKEEDSCKKIAEMHPYASYLKDSKCAILVCGDKNKSYGDYWPLDTSAATQNILLTATDLGLGSVWCGLYPNEKLCENIKQMFNLPLNIIPLSLVVLGYSEKEGKTPEDRFVESKIHYNKW